MPRKQKEVPVADTIRALPELLREDSFLGADAVLLDDLDQPTAEEIEHYEANREDEGNEEQDELASLDVAALRNRREELLKELESLEDLLADKQMHILVTSKVMGPCALFRQMFIEMHAAGKPRKDIIAFAVRKGIAPNTAKTQYQQNKQKWDRGELSIEDLEDEG